VALQRIAVANELGEHGRAVELGRKVSPAPLRMKALENDRLLVPRVPMLLRLAEVLGVADLADLTGDQAAATGTP
jgi:hypothetical protein